MLPRPSNISFVLSGLTADEKRDLSSAVGVTVPTINRWKTNASGIRSEQCKIIHAWIQQKFDEALPIERFNSPIEYGA